MPLTALDQPAVSFEGHVIFPMSADGRRVLIRVSFDALSTAAHRFVADGDCLGAFEDLRTPIEAIASGKFDLGDLATEWITVTSSDFFFRAR